MFSRKTLGLLVGLSVVLLIEASALLPAFDRQAIDDGHRAVCRENLLAILGGEAAASLVCPADPYAELRPEDQGSYPDTVTPGGGVVAFCPHHEPGFLTVADSGEVRLVRWEELGLRNRIMVVLSPPPRHPLLTTLGYD